jgi:hypothetical protein
MTTLCRNDIDPSVFAEPPPWLNGSARPERAARASAPLPQHALARILPHIPVSPSPSPNSLDVDLTSGDVATLEPLEGLGAPVNASPEVFLFSPEQGA